MAKGKTLRRLFRVVFICLVVGTMLLGLSPAMVSADLAADAYEPDDTPAAARVISADGTAQSHTIYPAADVDYLKFSATAEVAYAIETSNLADGCDTYIYLYDTDGTTVIDEDDDSASEDLASRIAFTPEASGIYYVKVQDIEATSGTGSYDIDVGLNDATGSISGLVEDESGQPIVGAMVVARSQHSTSSVYANAGTDGSYSITGLLTDNYVVLALANGYAMVVYDNVQEPSLATQVSVTAPDNTANINFTLGVGGSISGAVENGSGNPLRGAIVSASGTSPTHWGYAITDNGSYSIAGLPTDNYTVAVEAHGYVTEYYEGVYEPSLATLVRVTAPNDNPDIDFALETGGSISGVVKDESNNPIQGAWVYASGDTLGWAYAYTSDNGGYSITGLLTDNYTVWVQADGYAIEYYNGVYDSSLATPVTVTLPNNTPDIDFVLGPVADTTPPSTPVVTDDGATTYSASQLHATWISTDNETGIEEYEYAIGTTSGGTDVLDWTSTGTSTEVTRTGLMLTAGVTYYFAVKAKNNAGLWSAVGMSDGIQVTTDAIPPSTPAVTDDGATTTSTTQLHATWTSTDAESGIAEYQYAIGITSGGTDVLSWTSAGTSTEVTKTGLSLTVGTTYYFAVKAKNGAGLWSAVGASNGIQVVADATPPSTPAVTDDGATTTSAMQLHATWTSTDAESGIAEYQYAIGTTSGGTDVVNWTSAGTNAQATKTGLSLTAGTTYYISVKARNGQNAWSAVGTSDGIKVITPSDSTAPATPVVTDDGDTTTGTTQLHATWSATDAESGIAEYQYAIGTTSGGTDVLDWTSAGTGAAVTKTGLSLSAGTKYFISVKAKNSAGLWSEIGKSNGITVAPEGWAAKDVPSAGGEVQTADGKITVEFPANASSGPLTVAVGGTTSPSDAGLPKGFKAGNTCFAIEITDAAGNPVTTLSQPITITVKYSQEDVDAAGGDPGQLVLAYYDKDAGKWVKLETTVNTTDKTLSATTTHTSTWGTLAKSAGGGGTPSWVWILVAIAVVAVAAIALVIWRRAARKPASASQTPQ